MLCDGAWNCRAYECFKLTDSDDGNLTRLCICIEFARYHRMHAVIVVLGEILELRHDLS